MKRSRRVAPPSLLRWGGVILLAIVGTTTLSSCANPFGGREPVVLAVVGTEPLTDRDLRESILRRYYGRRGLLGLVRETLFRQEAEDLGIVITDEEVQIRVRDQLTEYLEGFGDQRRFFLEDLRQRGLDLDDVREELASEWRNQLLIQKVVQAHRVVGEGELIAAYEKGFGAARARVRHIAFPFEASGTPTDAQVSSARTRAEEVRARIAKGDNFGAVAREVSGNPTTGRRGGAMGWIAKNNRDFDPRIVDALFSLPLDTVSEPVREQDYGFHLLLVEERMSERSFAEAREDIEKYLRNAAPTSQELFQVEETLRARRTVTLYLDSLGSPTKKTDAPPDEDASTP